MLASRRSQNFEKQDNFSRLQSPVVATGSSPTSYGSNGSRVGHDMKVRRCVAPFFGISRRIMSALSSANRGRLFSPMRGFAPPNVIKSTVRCSQVLRGRCRSSLSQRQFRWSSPRSVAGPGANCASHFPLTVRVVILGDKSGQMYKERS